MGFSFLKASHVSRAQTSRNTSSSCASLRGGYLDIRSRFACGLGQGFACEETLPLPCPARPALPHAAWFKPSRNFLACSISAALAFMKSTRTLRASVESVFPFASASKAQLARSSGVSQAVIRSSRFGRCLTLDLISTFGAGSTTSGLTTAGTLSSTRDATPSSLTTADSGRGSLVNGGFGGCA